MEADYADIISRIKNALYFSPHRRVLVVVAGPPGSGKTTIATQIVGLLNGEVSRVVGNEKESPSSFAVSVSVDGFHYTREYLDTWPNRDEAYLRRGAPWTFDVDGIVRLARLLQNSAAVSVEARDVVKAPSFDHALKDPVEDDIQIGPETSVIVLEGNYLLLDKEEWREVSELADVKVFVDVDVDCARNRVAKRHVAAGIEDTYQKAIARFDGNDALNGDLVRKNLVRFDVRVESFDTM
jgi:pantothenate kinase